MRYRDRPRSRTPDGNLHPEAYKYLQNFQKHKQELSERLYALYNREVFGDSLPHDTEIFWSGRLVKTAGRCHNKRKPGTQEHFCQLELSSKVLDACDRLRDTLIHEMCHAATWIISKKLDGHGPVWKSWGNKAMKRFPELPFIGRCHTYKIRTRYVYECVGCGKQYGRHSKSVDTTSKNGKYELVAESANLQTPAKAPNAFAMFVKENYKHCRTPGSSHKEAMALLSQKFAATKL